MFSCLLFGGGIFIGLHAYKKMRLLRPLQFVKHGVICSFGAHYQCFLVSQTRFKSSLLPGTFGFSTRELFVVHYRLNSPYIRLG